MNLNSVKAVHLFLVFNMKAELEKAQEFTNNKEYKEALEVLLSLEQNIGENIFLQGEVQPEAKMKIYEDIFKNYKSLGDLSSALDYYKKFAEEEYQQFISENESKTEKISSAMKIHSAQKETQMLQEKNEELNKANEDLGLLREKKNELLKSVSEELKLPIVTIEGIAFNYYRAIKNDGAVNTDEIKNDLDTIESLSREILENVNSILQKNKEDHTA